MYEPRDLFAQVAYLGRHLHWTLSDVLNLEHRDREAFIDAVSDQHVALAGAEADNG